MGGWQWDVFTQYYRVLCFDMRGFGKSDPATGLVSRRQDLYCLLQELGIEWVNILGCSMDREIAIDFTLEHPGTVASLVIANGTPSGFESELQISLWVEGVYCQPEQVDSHVRKRAAEINR